MESFDTNILKDCSRDTRRHKDMSTELFDQLEKKVTHALETIDKLRSEVEELRTENETLKSSRHENETRLSSLLSRFSEVEVNTSSSESSEQAQTSQEHSHSHHTHY